MARSQIELATGAAERREDHLEVAGPGGVVEQRPGECDAAVSDQPASGDLLLVESHAQLADRLGDEARTGPVGDRDMQDLPGSVVDEHQHVELAQGERVDREEVTGDDPRRLGAQEPPPRGGPVAGCGGEAVAAQDRPHRRRRDRNTEAAELAVDAPVSPGGVLSGHPAHQRLDGGIYRWASPAATRPAGPSPGGQSAVPGEHRVGLDEQRRPAMAGQYSGERREHRAVRVVVGRTCDLTAQHHVLVAQDHQLDVALEARAASQSHQLEGAAQGPVEKADQHRRSVAGIDLDRLVGPTGRTLGDVTVTLDLPEDALERLRAEADRRGVSVDGLVAELAAALPAQSPRGGRRLSFIGIGHSGRGDLARRHREVRAEETAELKAKDF